MKLTQLFIAAIAQVTGKTKRINYYDKTAHSKAGIVSYRYACYMCNMTDEEVEKVRQIIAEQYTGKFTVHLLDPSPTCCPKLCLTVKLPVPYILKRTGLYFGRNTYEVYADGKFVHGFEVAECNFIGGYGEQNKIQTLSIVEQLIKLGYVKVPSGMYSKTTQL